MRRFFFCASVFLYSICLHAQSHTDSSTQTVNAKNDAIDSSFTKQQQYEHLNKQAQQYVSEEKYSIAIDYYVRALAMARSMESDEAEMKVLTSIGKTEMLLKDYKSAISCFVQSYKLARQKRNIDAQAEALLYFSQSNLITANYEKAIDGMQEYILLKDSISGRNQQNILQKKIEPFNLPGKDEEVKTLKKQNTIAEETLREKESETSQLQWILFVVAIIFVTLASIILWILFRTGKKVRQIEERLQTQNRIAEELHDNIGSSLSSIAIYSDVASRQLNDKVPQSAILLNTISDTAHVTMDNMNDVIWSLNSSNDNFENIFSRMQKFAAAVLETKNIEVHFRTSEKLRSKKLSVQQCADFYLMFKESVNFLAKYSHPVNVWITLNIEENILYLVLKEDGIGFNTDHLSDNGLRSMQKKAESVNGVFNISSDEDGTMLQLQMPLE